jgi:hypothetical protein
MRRSSINNRCKQDNERFRKQNKMITDDYKRIAQSHHKLHSAFEMSPAPISTHHVIYPPIQTVDFQIKERNAVWPIRSEID